MSTFKVLQFITAPSKFESENGSRQLSRRAAKGELTRISHGLYLPTAVWNALPPWHKYRMRIQAVHELAHTSPVFSRESAAQIMGLPILSTRDRVHTLVAPGQGGGRNSEEVQRSQAIPGDTEPWEMFGLLVTNPVQTARDMAVKLPFVDALPAMDKALDRKILPGSPPNVNLGFTEKHVLEASKLLPFASQQARVLRVLNAADPRSQSAGESFSRALMIVHGFPAPDLQREFRDRHGLVGFSDFDWEELKIIGEFDGYEKYSAQRFLRGRTPSSVVVEEKKREDRLRTLGYTVVRWIWDDLKRPERLIAQLRAAGLPQSRS